MKNKWAVRSIEYYQRKISPKTNITCRHTPSCSQYGKEAFERFNFFKAFFLTTKRLLTCNPLFKRKHDPTPERKRKPGFIPDKTILVTAFEPYGGDIANSSMLILNEMPNYIDDILIKTLVIPTSFNQSFKVLKEYLDNNEVDYILMLGQAAKRNNISLEIRAKNNLLENKLDNDGKTIIGSKLDINGEDFYYTKFNSTNLITPIFKRGLPIEISSYAGEYVCNYIYYKALKELPHKSLFIHTPKVIEQDNENESWIHSSRLMSDIVKDVIREMIKQ